MAEPSKCPHLNFMGQITVNRLTNDRGDLTGFNCDLTVTCTDCNTPFVWLGVPEGLNLDGVAVAVGGEQLRAAIAPHFGWIPPGGFLQPRGFKVSLVEGEGGHDGH